MNTTLRCLPLALVFGLSLSAATGGCQPSYVPCYTADDVVNAASSVAGSVAPFTFVSIFGTNLSYVSRPRYGDDSLPGFGGVDVLIQNQPSFVAYVSPVQVNFLMPSGIRDRYVTLQVVREGVAGPAVTIELHDCAPALFMLDEVTAVAAHLDWTLVTQDSPAQAGELVVLYANGLGAFLTPLDDLEIPTGADMIARREEFRILINGQPVDDSLILYAGAAPLFIGVYQINLRLPDNVGPNPDIQIALGDQISPTGIRLPVQ
jgi:uncharacterized protein (TIGR03437 family)